MRWVPGGRAEAERARWLAELSDALDEVQLLLQRMGVSATDSPVGAELSLRIEGARFSIETLRRERRDEWSEVSRPKRSQKLPWRQRGAC